jgi:hypothetical protein
MGPENPIEEGMITDFILKNGERIEGEDEVRIFRRLNMLAPSSKINSKQELSY